MGYPLKRINLFLASLVFICASCASDSYLRNAGHSAFKNRDWETAAVIFGESAKELGSNQLLFKLDQATSLFNSGDYRAAIDIFLEAEDLAEIKDYTSISEEVGVLATGQGVRGYKGEDYEKVLINVYLALSFAALGEIEEAQVECRKINLLLNKMIDDGKRNYQESPFARYLSGILWEATGNYNSAYIDYKMAHELAPELPGLDTSLIQAANKLGFRKEENEWRQSYPNAALNREKKGYGELVVIYQQGRGPRKIPRYENRKLPRYVTYSGPDLHSQVFIDGEELGFTEPAMNISQTSERYLEDRIGRLQAASIAGTVGKAAIGFGVAKATKNDDLGLLTFLVLDAMDQADLRSWLSLPNSLQIKRIVVPEGKHQVELKVFGLDAHEMRTIDLGEVEIKSRKKMFRVAR